MRRTLLLAAVLIAVLGATFAQYPNVSIKQIQQVPMDSLLVADTLSGLSANANNVRWTLQTSPYMGDTVTVTALCVAPAFVVTYTASGWTMVLYDTGAVAPWSGILVRANINDSTQLIADGFLSIAAGDIITMTGVVSEFPTTRGGSLTQFQPIAGNPIAIIGSAPLPQPFMLDIADFYTGVFPSGQVRYSTGEQYEGMLVEFHKVIVNNKVNPTRGTFSVVDQAFNEISDYDWSHFFTLGHGNYGPDTAWQRIYASLGNGVLIDTLRGIISTSSGSESPRGYRLCPLYPSDVVLGNLPAPPLVSTHRRNPVIVPPDSTPTVSVKVTRQLNGSLPKTVSLVYSLANGPFTSVPMTFTASDTTYVGTIGQQPAGTFVRYFIQVADSFTQVVRLANSSTSGASLDTSKGFFFYTVLDRPLRIADVQYTPYIHGRTAYLGAEATLSGIITADTLHIGISPLSNGGTTAWYMQSTNAPWSGIWLTAADTLAQAALSALRNGDSVSVKGTIQEQFDVTRLGNITQVAKVSSGNPEPAPVVLNTGSFNVGNGAPSAEPYEGMLVRFTNVVITNVNPTFSDPTEFAINSNGTGDMIVRRDGLTSYSNLEADTASGKTILRVGNSVSSFTGIIYYSFNQYKVVPRTDADLLGVVLTGVEQSTDTAVPTAYALAQNYPNPFNPTTVVSYQLPAGGDVRLVVYDLLGREVAVLVNQAQGPGSYTVNFNASGLSSGVYLYRLQAGSVVYTRKMVVLK